MFVPKAVYEILKDYPDGLTAKKITEEVIARGLHPLPAKQPVSIVTRAIHRHCIGIDRTYSCQDRFFSKSTNKQGDTVYKIAANYSTTTTAIAETLSFWTNQDIWDYIKLCNLPVSDLYSQGYQRNGCMYCGFGLCSERRKFGINRFERLAQTHPKQYEYMISRWASLFKECGIPY